MEYKKIVGEKVKGRREERSVAFGSIGSVWGGDCLGGGRTKGIY